MSDKSHQQGLKMDGPSGPGSRQGGSQQGGSRHGGSQHGGTQHGGSQHGGSQHGGSQHGGSPKRSGSSPFPEGLGYDPAVQSGPLGEEDLDDMHRASLPTRIDLPPEAYIRVRTPKNITAHDGLLTPSQCLKESPFPLRPAYNSSGKDVMLKVNQFRMETADCPDIWQYDVGSPSVPDCVYETYKSAGHHRQLKPQFSQVRRHPAQVLGHAQCPESPEEDGIQVVLRREEVGLVSWRAARITSRETS